MPRKGNLHWISSETGQNSEYFWTGIWCYMSSSSNWVPNVKIQPSETTTKIYSKEKCTPQGTDGLCASIHATSLSMVSVTHVNFTREFFACWRHYQKTIVDRVFSRSAGSCVQKENSEHSWGHRAQIRPKLWTQGKARWICTSATSLPPLLWRSYWDWASCLHSGKAPSLRGCTWLLCPDSVLGHLKAPVNVKSHLKSIMVTGKLPLTQDQVGVSIWCDTNFWLLDAFLSVLPISGLYRHHLILFLSWNL